MFIVEEKEGVPNVNYNNRNDLKYRSLYINQINFNMPTFYMFFYMTIRDGFNYENNNICYNRLKNLYCNLE